MLFIFILYCFSVIIALFPAYYILTYARGIPRWRFAVAFALAAFLPIVNISSCIFTVTILIQMVKDYFKERDIH